MSALNRAKSIGRKAPFDLIIPEAAHPGFDKAAHLMGAKAIRLASNPLFRAYPEQIKASVGPNTVLLAASAPSFPFGVTDRVDELADIAKESNLWLHVDACHGGFVLPFAQQLGYAIPTFDLSIDGVTTLSVDLHKLGYATKGASALLLADAKNERYQRYTFDDWPGGRYSTAGLMGSRSAGGLASAWAMIQILDRSGYREIVLEILTARDQLVRGINQLQGLSVLGNPDPTWSHLPQRRLTSWPSVKEYPSRGWVTGHLTRPQAIHLFLDRHNATAIPEYLSDLGETLSEVERGLWAGGRADTVYTR